VRTPEETQVLHAAGERIRIYQLQGDLTFASAEAVIRDVIEKINDIEHLILDLKRVLTINESACRLFYELLRKFSALGKPVVFTHANRLSLLRQYLKAKLGPGLGELFLSFEDNDLALEWCENRALATAGKNGAHRFNSVTAADRIVEHSEYELLEKF